MSAAQAAPMQSGPLPTPPSYPSAQSYSWILTPNGWGTTIDDAKQAVIDIAKSGNANAASSTNFPAYVLMSDSMNFQGAIGMGQTPGRVGTGGIPAIPGDPASVWSPDQSLGFYGLSTGSSGQDIPASAITFTESNEIDTDCAQFHGLSPDNTTGPVPHLTTMWNAWCMQPLTYSLTTTATTPTPGYLLSQGLDWQVDVKKAALEAAGFGDVLTMSGPNNQAPGMMITASGFLVTLNPQLQLIKQVCVNYDTVGHPTCTVDDDSGWVTDTTYGDDNGTAGIPQGVTTGVEEGAIPPDVTDLLWRLTAANPGNVPLTGIHVPEGGDVVNVSPDPSSALTVDNQCDGATFPDTYDASGAPQNVFEAYRDGLSVSSQNALLPGDTMSIACHTILSKPYSGIVQNSASLNASWDDPTNPIYRAPDFSAADGNNAVNHGQDPLVLGTPLMDRFTGNQGEAGQVPSNIDSAQVDLPAPQLKVTKWVCDMYDASGAPTCTVPIEHDLMSLAGLGDHQNDDGTWEEVAGTAPVGSGWAKEATIPYDATAQWLIVVTNTGNTTLRDVQLTDALANDPMRTALTPQLASGGTLTSLPSGASAVFLAQSSNVTNLKPYNPGVDASGISHGEPIYLTGDDIVNTVQATATVVNPVDGTDLTYADGDTVTTTSNTSNAEVDTLLYAVGDYVWLDANGDGQQGSTSSEPGIPGVTVSLLHANGAPVLDGTGQPMTTTTNAQGLYWFDGLVAGTYEVRFSLPTNPPDGTYVWTTPTTGAHQTDSDAKNAVGGSTDRVSDPFTLGDGQSDMMTVGTGTGQYAANPALIAREINPTIDAGVRAVHPDVHIVKYDTLNGDDVTTGHHDGSTAEPPKVLDAGTTTPMAFTVTNSGDEPLVDVAVADATTSGVGTVTGLQCMLPGQSTWTSAGSDGKVHWAGPFAPGASFDCQGTLTALAPGDTHVDTATVTGAGQYSGNPVTDNDEWHGRVPHQPSVQIVKYDTLNGDDMSTGHHGLTQPAKVLSPDTQTPISFTITNTGTEPLLDVVVTDTPASGSAYLTSLSCIFPDGDLPIAAGTDHTVRWAGPFAVGDSFTCTGVLAGLPAGASHADTASVQGVGQYSGTTVTDNDTWHANVPGHPGIAIVKYDTLNGDNATTGHHDAAVGEPAKDLVAGATTPMAFTITNTGDESLVDVAVSDATTAGTGTVTGLECQFPGSTTWTALGSDGKVHWAGPFAVGASFQCRGTLTALAPGDVHTDEATVTGAGQYSGQPVTDNDRWHGDVPYQPDVQIVKYDTLNGDNATTGHHAMSEAAKVLDVGATTPISFTITNNGDEPLVDVVVTDTPATGSAHLTSLACTFPGQTTPTPVAPGSNGSVRWPGPFAVGASFPCTGTLAGLAAGDTHADTASVDGTGQFSGVPVTDNDTWHAVVPTTPAVHIVKYDTLNGDTPVTGHHDGSAAEPAKVLEAGLTTPMGFIVTNTGDEALVDVAVSDQTTAGIGTVTGLECQFPGSTTWTALGSDGKVHWAGPFAVGASFTCRGTLTALTDGSTHTDQATVTGTGQISGTSVTDTDLWNGKAENPGTDIVKYDTLGGDTAITGHHGTDETPKDLQPNIETPISFTVRNTGTEPLVSVVVSDQPAPGSDALTGLSCVLPGMTTPTAASADGAVHWAGPFAVGASFTCSGILPGMPVGAVHQDTATVNATGQFTGKPVHHDDTWNGDVPSYAVGDYVWNDENQNGLQDPGESGVPGLVVKLLSADSAHTQVATTVTDAQGYYFFDGLAAGDYQVQFSLPVDYVWTTRFAGDQALDSNADTVTGLSDVFTLDAGQPHMVAPSNASVPADYASQITADAINPTIDAGVYLPTPQPALGFALGDFVWVDSNGNGQQDPGEPGVAGATVALLDASGAPYIDPTTGQPAVATTDKNGYYLFDMLPGGDYQLAFTLPAGYLWTQANVGNPKTDSDAGFTANTQASATSAVFTLDSSSTNILETTDPSLPAYGVTLQADYIDPTWDAGVIPIAPQIALEKYVCTTGTGCVDPTDPTFQMTSLDNPSGGWVKATTVVNGTSADWLVLIKNTGNVPMSNITLTREDFAAGGAGFTNKDCLIPDPYAQVLMPGDFLSWTCTVDKVTNTADLGSGKDVVNTAQAQGTPSDKAGTPLNAIGGTPWGPVATNTASAEVNTTPIPQAKTGGTVQSSSAGLLAGVLITLGVAIMGGVAIRRRRV